MLDIEIRRKRWYEHNRGEKQTSVRQQRVYRGCYADSSVVRVCCAQGGRCHSLICSFVKLIYANKINIFYILKAVDVRFLIRQQRVAEKLNI